MPFLLGDLYLTSGLKVLSSIIVPLSAQYGRKDPSVPYAAHYGASRELTLISKYCPEAMSLSSTISSSKFAQDGNNRSLNS